MKSRTRKKIEELDTGVALVAGATVGVAGRPTQALAAAGVAEVVERADRVALARRAALRSEAVRSRRALVAAAAHHVRFALTLTACESRQKTAVESNRVRSAMLGHVVISF